MSGNSIVFGQPLTRAQWEQWPSEARVIAELLEPVIEGLRQGRETSEVEVPVHGHGRQVLSFSSALLRHPDGRAAGGIVVVRDVTTRRDVERLKDEILAIASHDLKTPVTVLKGHIHLLRRQYAGGRPDPDRVARGWKTLDRQCDQLVELIDLLLNFSRIEADRLALHREKTDLVGLARSVVEGVQAMTERHRLLVHGPRQVEGLWDERTLEQVLRNLVTNAVKYSPDGGTVEVAIQAVDDQATISVRDEGVGIAPEELPRVFERFYRSEGIRRLEGSGLGLYICDRIVSAHGGRIWADSLGPGHGSTFHVTLPLHG